MQQPLCEQFSLQLLSTEGLVLNTLSTDFTETWLESSFPTQQFTARVVNRPEQ